MRSIYGNYDSEISMSCLKDKNIIFIEGDVDTVKYFIDKYGIEYTRVNSRYGDCMFRAVVTDPKDELFAAEEREYSLV